MVHIVGAGSGAVDLITLRGKKFLEEADVVIYAGSLVNPELLDFCREDALIFNSAEMTLDQVLEVVEKAEAEHKTTVRLHTGDPSIYGAIKEQMDAFDRKKIPYDVTPGVSSFLAAAASLKIEYTLPSVSQTVILTRISGRTLVPESESLQKLAAHHATMCIFLSVDKIRDVVRELSQEYDLETPIAVVKKASWADEKIIRGTLSTIADLVEFEHIDRTAMIIVGRCLGSDYELSKLYDKNFSHGFRIAET